MAELMVFIPAWNEAPSLPGVLDELAAVLPEADVLVVDDGSTDPRRHRRAHGVELLSFQSNQGLRAAIAAGYSYAEQHGYALCGRVDGDGQHPAAELERLLNEVRADRCDVAVGSRFVSGEGFENQRYRLHGARRYGTAYAWRHRTLLRHPFHDP